MIHKPTFKYMFMSHYATEVCKCPDFTPQEGDIVFWEGHVGLVTEVSKDLIDSIHEEGIVAYTS